MANKYTDQLKSALEYYLSQRREGDAIEAGNQEEADKQFQIGQDLIKAAGDDNVYMNAMYSGSFGVNGSALKGGTGQESYDRMYQEKFGTNPYNEKRNTEKGEATSDEASRRRGGSEPAGVVLLSGSGGGNGMEGDTMLTKGRKKTMLGSD